MNPDHKILEGFGFFTNSIKIYQNFYLEGIKQGHLNLLIPEYPAFENGVETWEYVNGVWVHGEYEPDRKKWRPQACEVPDAKTV